jgi:ribosomal protein S27AE
MKHCDRCDAVKPLDDFKDDDLVTGYGRQCLVCKNKKAISVKREKNLNILEDKKCPRCGSGMIVRVRRSDQHKFYGCSRFPRCKGTSIY